MINQSHTHGHERIQACSNHTHGSTLTQTSTPAYVIPPVWIVGTAALVTWQLIDKFMPNDTNGFDSNTSNEGEEDCPSCSGTGYQSCMCTKWQNASSQMSAKCQKCNGTKLERCNRCNGRGTLIRIMRKQEVPVRRIRPEDFYRHNDAAVFGHGHGHGHGYVHGHGYSQHMCQVGNHNIHVGKNKLPQQF